MPVRCVAFDADDTLWDFTTAMWQGLTIALATGAEVAPRLVEGVTAEDLVRRRDRLADEAEASGEPHRLADIRVASFAEALRVAGAPEPEADRVAAVMAEAYFGHRHGEVALHDEVIDVLGRLAERYVLGLVTNGNTDVAASAVADRFEFVLVADQIGLRKPDPRIFAMAAAAAGCHPSELVYVGDDPRRDVVASQAAGARGVWLDRAGAQLPAGVAPDASIAHLGELPGVLERFDQDEAVEAAAVGVGPHPEPWPDDPRLDLALLATGDRRNVVDRYRYWREDAIVADLDSRRHPFHVAVENWRHDRNIGAVVRNANAFGAAGVHIVGRRRWNRRGAMATDRYLPVHHHDTVDDLVRWARDEGLELVAIDNVDGARPLEEVVLPERCVLVFGQEGPGLSRAALDAATTACAITQYGSTRSLNAGVASGIAMHAWVRAHAATQA